MGGRVKGVSFAFRLEQLDGIVITPYERNLEFWRQLWQVVERSDVLVQVVDARQPLLFFSTKLDDYIREVDSHKETVVLINKSDFLTRDQRCFTSACCVLACFYEVQVYLHFFSE